MSDQFSRWYPLFLLLGLFLVTAGPGQAQIPDDGVGPPDPPLGPQPQIFFESIEYDWDSVVQGTRVRHAFKVRNRGDATLEP